MLYSCNYAVQMNGPTRMRRETLRSSVNNVLAVFLSYCDSYQNNSLSRFLLPWVLSNDRMTDEGQIERRVLSSGI
jgi:hypothetical protein